MREEAFIFPVLKQKGEMRRRRIRTFGRTARQRLGTCFNAGRSSRGLCGCAKRMLPERTRWFFRSGRMHFRHQYHELREQFEDIGHARFGIDGFDKAVKTDPGDRKQP
jgi:hypothetical protein